MLAWKVRPPRSRCGRVLTSAAELCGRTWTPHRVSPLYRFLGSEHSLRLYGVDLSRVLAGASDASPSSLRLLCVAALHHFTIATFVPRLQPPCAWSHQRAVAPCPLIDQRKARSGSDTRDRHGAPPDPAPYAPRAGMAGRLVRIRISLPGRGVKPRAHEVLLWAPDEAELVGGALACARATACVRVTTSLGRAAASQSDGPRSDGSGDGGSFLPAHIALTSCPQPVARAVFEWLARRFDCKPALRPLNLHPAFLLELITVALTAERDVLLLAGATDRAGSGGGGGDDRPARAPRRGAGIARLKANVRARPPCRRPRSWASSLTCSRRRGPLACRRSSCDLLRRPTSPRGG